jgi:hypothetical protein
MMTDIQKDERKRETYGQIISPCSHTDRDTKRQGNRLIGGQSDE